MKAAFDSLPYLMDGLLVTLQVTFLVVVFATIIGVIFGVGISYGPLWLRILVRIFSDFIRGIPVLVLIFFVYYGLPAIGINMETFTAAVVALSIFKISHVIENTRGAIQSVHHGQMEAGKAIGLKFHERLIYIIFPLAIRRFLPPWINSVADTAKGSALVSLIGVVDLMLAMQKVIGRTYEAMPVYIVGLVIYFIINYCLSLSSRKLEAKFAYIKE
ncbi:MAG: amino acid ABC transporter permease [SAR324 cluster bacterium]|jgi:polar amino acid transport system permease protein|nr:amino acid ABC transporter permease [SAR324 cluster bacterium]